LEKKRLPICHVPAPEGRPIIAPRFIVGVRRSQPTKSRRDDRFPDHSKFAVVPPMAKLLVTGHRSPYLSWVSDVDKQSPQPDIPEQYAHGHAGQKAADPGSHPGSEVAGQAHGDLAADAAAYLDRSGETLQSLDGGPQAIERQSGHMIAWARETGLILPQSYTADFQIIQSSRFKVRCSKLKVRSYAFNP